MAKYSDYIKEQYRKKLEEFQKKHHPEKFLQKQAEKKARDAELHKLEADIVLEEQQVKKTEEQKILEEVRQRLSGHDKLAEEKTSEEEQIEKAEEINKLSPISKKTIIIPSLIIVLAVLVGIYFLASPPISSKFRPLDIMPSNSSGLSMPVFYEGKPLFSFSGWESILELNNKTDRLFGNEQYKKIVFDSKGKAYTFISLDNKIQLEPLKANPEKVTKIGWFYETEHIKISDYNKRNEKTVNVKLEEGKILEEASLDYTFYKNKPYFKVQFFSQSDSDNIKDFAYGFILRDYDIALPNGTLIKNNNEIIPLNKTADIVLAENGNTTKNISLELVNSISTETDISRQAIQRKGSNFEVNTDYEIFSSQKEKKALVFYSPFALYFENSFYWNVYRVYVPYDDEGKHYPLYVFVFESPILEYKNNDWMIISEQYTGSLNYYIDDIYTRLEDKTGD